MDEKQMSPTEAPPPYPGVEGGAGAPYPTPGAGAPPPAGYYPPPQGAYPPPQGAYPPPQGAYPPPQGAYPPPGMEAPKGQYPQQPPAGAVVVQPQPTTVVVVGNCPRCHAGTIVDTFSCCGILLGIIFFPLGLICCLLMRDHRCTNCGASF